MSTLGFILADPTCVACGKPGSERHHLVRQGNPWLGEDLIANVVCLCTFCHGIFHRGMLWAEVGASIGDFLVEHRPDAVRYIVTRAGLGYAERYYGIDPETSAEIIRTYDRGLVS